MGFGRLAAGRTVESTRSAPMRRSSIDASTDPSTDDCVERTQNK